MSRILTLDNINKHYREGIGKLHVIKDLNFEVEKGEFISILGKSGSGKSTLLNLIGILDIPSSGNLLYKGIDVKKLSEKERDRLRNEVLGFVFQFHYLLPEFTALENVMIPAMLEKKSRKEIENRAKELLVELELGERMDHKPTELSGGEKQRVAIARALMNSPEILLADEPTGNLDDETSEHIHEILRKINKEMGQTILVVTHSHELADITDKKFLLKNGMLKEV